MSNPSLPKPYFPRHLGCSAGARRGSAGPFRHSENHSLVTVIARNEEDPWQAPQSEHPLRQYRQNRTYAGQCRGRDTWNSAARRSWLWGQVHRAFHRVVRQGAPPGAAEYRVCSLGDPHWLGHLEYHRRPAQSFAPGWQPMSSGSRRELCCWERDFCWAMYAGWAAFRSCSSRLNSSWPLRL